MDANEVLAWIMDDARAWGRHSGDASMSDYDEAEVLLRGALAPPKLLAEGRGWEEEDGVWIIHTDPEAILAFDSRYVLIVAAPGANSMTPDAPEIMIAEVLQAVSRIARAAVQMEHRGGWHGKATFWGGNHYVATRCQGRTHECEPDDLRRALEKEP